MHGFCTDSARFQNVQKVLFAAKSDKGCRNCRVKNNVALHKNDDEPKIPEIETNRRLALLISGPRVRVPGDAPDIELQIVRFGVLPLCRKAAAHRLHICPNQGRFCARLAQPAFLCIKRELVGARFLHLLSQIVLSLKHPTGAFVASQMQIFSANKALVNSLRSSASISRMASRISLPVIFVAAGVSFCWDFHKRLRQKGRLWGVLCGGE